VNRCCLPSTGTLAMTWAFATLAHAQPNLVVDGDTTCPSVEMIRAAWAAAGPSATWPEQTVTVQVADDRLALSLGEAPAVVREIPADADCSVRAETVAVIIAAWSGDLASHPTDSAVLTVKSPAPVLAPAVKSSHIVELGGAAFYSPGWGHAPGAWVDMGRMPRDRGIGARVFLAYQSARDVALEGGTNQILRLLAGAVVSYPLQSRLLFASVDVGLVGTLTRAQGSGYETNRTDSATNFGGVLELRGGLRLGRARLWLSGRGLRLVHAETVKVQSTSPGVADRAVLSAWDAQLGLGAGFRFE
jgi:hypothetical protein